MLQGDLIGNPHFGAEGITCCDVWGREARSKHSDTVRRKRLASSMLLKKMVCSATPSMPKVLFTLPTAAYDIHSLDPKSEQSAKDCTQPLLFWVLKMPSHQKCSGRILHALHHPSCQRYCPHCSLLHMATSPLKYFGTISMNLVCSAKSLIPEVLFMFPTAAKAPDHLNRMIKASQRTQTILSRQSQVATQENLNTTSSSQAMQYTATQTRLRSAAVGACLGPEVQILLQVIVHNNNDSC